MICFTSTKRPYGWLGNMAPFPVTYADQVWRTTEALFQALRFPANSPIPELIRAEKSPMAAKLVAKQHQDQMYVVPLSTQDVANMDRVIRLKVQQHPELQDLLLATDNELIVEDVSKRPYGNNLFWGAQVLDRTPGQGVVAGQNVLGELWMNLRKELRT